MSAARHLHKETGAGPSGPRRPQVPAPWDAQRWADLTPIGVGTCALIPTRLALERLVEGVRRRRRGRSARSGCGSSSPLDVVQLEVVLPLRAVGRDLPAAADRAGVLADRARVALREV